MMQASEPPLRAQMTMDGAPLGLDLTGWLEYLTATARKVRARAMCERAQCASWDPKGTNVFVPLWFHQRRR